MLLVNRGCNSAPRTGYPMANQRFFFTQRSCTFVVPNGVKLIKTLRLWGGGGSGGAGDNSTFGGGGGGSSGYQEKVNIAVNPGDLITITVGLGGAPTVAFSTTGSAGASTSVVAAGTTYQANGGNGGNSLTGGTGGTTNGAGSTNTNGSTGGSGSAGVGGTGANAVGTMPGIAGITGVGGAQVPSGSNPGNQGFTPGAGGSGAPKLSTTSGAGADGAVYIAW